MSPNQAPPAAPTRTPTHASPQFLHPGTLQLSTDSEALPIFLQEGKDREELEGPGWDGGWGGGWVASSRSQAGSGQGPAVRQGLPFLAPLFAVGETGLAEPLQ